MDPIKILLTLFLAFCSAVFGLLMTTPLIAVVVSADTDELPATLKYVAPFCALASIGCAVGTVLLIRSAWRQLFQKQSRKEADTHDVRESLSSGDLDISRITGAGWILGLVSLLVPCAIFAFTVTSMEWNPNPQRIPRALILAFVGIPAAGLFFGGRAVLNALNIGVIRKSVPQRRRRKRTRPSPPPRRR